MAAIVACTEPVVTGAAVSATIFLLWRAGSLPRRTCETERQKGMKKIVLRAHRMQRAMMIHITVEEVLVFITNKGVSHAKYTPEKIVTFFFQR